MPTGEKNLGILLRSMKPVLNAGEYVFCTSPGATLPPQENIICWFREKEGITLILEKTAADHLRLPYSFIASWITLTVHSSLEAVGLTAAFSKALATENISCNVVAGYYHDHIFVGLPDTGKAMAILQRFSEQ